MTVPHALTEPDVVELRRETTANGPVTVWFTEAAVGVPVGGSAKVVAVGEAGEGEFIQVRRSGSRDTMFCSPNELTRVRPSRAAATGKRAGSAGRGEKASAAVSSSPAPSRPASRASAARSAASAAAAPAPPAAKARAAAVPADVAPAAADSAVAAAPTAAPATAEPAPAPVAPALAAAAPAAPPAQAPAAPARPARARRDTARSSELSVTLSATAEGEWSVEVLAGKKRVVPSTAVPATAVAAAARALPDAVAEAVESSLEGARRRQRERVEQLRAELDAAQRVLDEFEG